MLERTETRFGIKPVSLTADSAYGSAHSLAWLVKEKDIAPHIPVFDKSNRTDGTFSRADFTSILSATVTPAPRAKSWSNSDAPSPEAASQPRAQDSIAPANWIATSARLRRVAAPTRSLARSRETLTKTLRDIARALASTPEYETACRRRKKIEMLFAHLKRILRLARLRLRGPNGAKDEFLLAATVQNLRRLARLRPINMVPQMLAA